MSSLLSRLFPALFIGLVALGGSSPARASHHRDDTCPGFQRPGASADADDKTLSELERSARKFANENGISVKFENGRFVFSLTAGKEIRLFSTDATQDGLKSAVDKLKKLVDAKAKDLRDNFDVEFTTEREVVDKQWFKNDKGEWEQGQDVVARAPRLNELYGIEAALYRAQPSQKAKGGGKGIKFYFLTDDLTKGERPLASWRANRDGRPAIHFYPGSTERPVLEREMPFDPTRTMGHGYGSIEALTLHEISHNHQNVVGWWSDLEKDEAEKYGFRDCGTDKDGNRIWAVKSTKTDSNGNPIYYRSNSSGTYTACDENGKDIAGEPEIFRSTLRKIAAHRPMTYYFPSPSETYAEGVMIYRLGGVYRASLLKENPALYEVVKRIDQKEIDLIYGEDVQYEWRSGYDQWGNQVWYQVEVSRTSRYIRDADGNLVRNTKSNAKSVSQFEKNARK